MEHSAFYFMTSKEMVKRHEWHYPPRDKTLEEFLLERIAVERANYMRYVSEYTLSQSLLEDKRDRVMRADDEFSTYYPSITWVDIQQIAYDMIRLQWLMNMYLASITLALRYEAKLELVHNGELSKDDYPF